MGASICQVLRTSFGTFRTLLSFQFPITSAGRLIKRTGADGLSRPSRDLLCPSYQQGSYFAFLGRFTAEKGPEEAIRIAHATGVPLRIAAKIPRGERRYFKDH